MFYTHPSIPVQGHSSWCHHHPGLRSQPPPWSWTLGFPLRPIPGPGCQSSLSEHKSKPISHIPTTNQMKATLVASQTNSQAHHPPFTQQTPEDPSLPGNARFPGSCTLTHFWSRLCAFPATWNACPCLSESCLEISVHLPTPPQTLSYPMSSQPLCPHIRGLFVGQSWTNLWKTGVVSMHCYILPGTNTQPALYIGGSQWKCVAGREGRREIEGINT